MRRAITLLCSVIKLLSLTSECKLIFCVERIGYTHTSDTFTKGSLVFSYM